MLTTKLLIPNNRRKDFFDNLDPVSVNPLLLIEEMRLQTHLTAVQIMAPPRAVFRGGHHGHIQAQQFNS
jgi:hypothetical protein